MRGDRYGNDSKREVIIFNDKDLTIEVNISPEEDTVWLSLNQISDLFDKNKTTVSRHIKNIFNEGELDRSSTVAKNATVQKEGNREIIREVDYYNLDLIISVGYRVKSKRATLFRKWATAVLNDYTIRGYAINKNKFSYEKQIQLLKLLERSADRIESKEILDILEVFTLSLQLLDDYDHQRIQKPNGTRSTYRLEYEECMMLIKQMKYNHDTDIFGIEREGVFKSSIGAIYQTFDGKEVYTTLEEKAAHLLYFLVKNHGFIDGNKRIGAALFVYFLEKNDALINDGTQVIGNKTLVSLTIMLAESNPNEKELLVNLIMNLLKM